MTAFEVLLHASETAHVDSPLGALAGVAVFLLFLASLKVLSSELSGGWTD